MTELIGLLGDGCSRPGDLHPPHAARAADRVVGEEQRACSHVGEHRGDVLRDRAREHGNRLERARCRARGQVEGAQGQRLSLGRGQHAAADFGPQPSVADVTA